jgi:hypothetical protein
MTTRRCETCDYWQQLTAEQEDLADYGRCHRHSPMVTGSLSRARWPETGRNDWCGEWAPRREDALVAKSE